MKRSFLSTTFVLAFGMAVVSASDRISEEAAVSQLKKARASQLDASLPSRTFGAWLTEKFDGWDVQWRLHDCGPERETAKIDTGKDSPVCVQVNIMEPAQEIYGDASNGFHLLFQVGTERKGLIATPRLRDVMHKDGDEVQHLASLGEVEP